MNVAAIFSLLLNFNCLAQHSKSLNTKVLTATEKVLNYMILNQGKNSAQTQ